MPYSEQLLKWYPYYDPSRPCALICRGEPINSSGRSNNNNNNNDEEAIANVAPPRQPEQASNVQQPGSSVEEYESEDSIVVQLADKVQDGTRCYPDGKDICINGECMVSADSRSFFYLFIYLFFFCLRWRGYFSWHIDLPGLKSKLLL